jgi:hypothetical protein
VLGEEVEHFVSHHFNRLRERIVDGYVGSSGTLISVVSGEIDRGKYIPRMKVIAASSWTVSSKLWIHGESLKGFIFRLIVCVANLIHQDREKQGDCEMASILGGYHVEIRSVFGQLTILDREDGFVA